jgi:16S rRNA (cytosine967-C5)-methyltransferase
MRITRLQIDMLAEAIAEAQDSTRPADVLLHHFFRAHPELGARDRSVVAEGLFAWLRRRRSIEVLAGTQHPILLALATLVRDQGHSVRELGPLLREQEGAWLEEFKGRRVELSPAVAHDVPDWLWDRLGEVVTDEERSAMTRSWLQQAPLDIRINCSRPSEVVQEEPAGRRHHRRADAALPAGTADRGRPALNRLVRRREHEVQDEGSQLVAFLVAPRRGEMVVDFCAGAGGKTLALGVLMRSQGRLYAFDTVDKRLQNLKPRLARSGLSNVHPQLIAHERDTKIKRLAGKVDRFWWFATLRRNPPSGASRSRRGVRRKQRAILAAAATLVKPGRLSMTCSVPDETGDGRFSPANTLRAATRRRAGPRGISQYRAAACRRRRVHLRCSRTA